MKSLAKLVRFCFGLEAISLIGGVPLLFSAIYMLFKHTGPDLLRHRYLSPSMGIMLLATAINVAPAIAWWTIKKGSPSARRWALAASVVNLPIPIPGLAAMRSSSVFAYLLHIPVEVCGALIGLAGLVAFSRSQVVTETADRRRPSPLRITGDGTSRWADYIAYALGIGWIWISLGWWNRWGYNHGIQQVEYLPWLLHFEVAIFLTTVIHELGHLCAGRALDMSLRSFRAGPLAWYIRNGRWNFKFQLGGLLLGGGAVGHVPLHLANIRRRMALTILAGPIASLVLALICGAAALTAKDAFWQPLWTTLSLTATISSSAFLVNMIPQQPDSNYSDGARLIQTLTNGPWAQVDLAFAMTTASLVTPARPRDWDIEVIRRAAAFITKGVRGMLLRMFASQHYVEIGRIPEAVAALEAAENLFPGLVVEKPQDFCSEFVFLNALFKRDPARAEMWWRRMEDQPNLDLDADYWMARSSILWVRGQTEDARDAWERGHKLAIELPASGAYDHTRWAFERLRQAFDTPPPQAPASVEGSRAS